MQVIFKDKELERLRYDDSYTPKGLHTEVIQGFVRAVSYLEAAENITEIYRFKSLHYEILKGRFKGKHSIRVNKQRRILFTLDQYGNVTIICIESLSKHYE